jgi:DNA-binding transcriptional LysR family regulator
VKAFQHSVSAKITYVVDSNYRTIDDMDITIRAAIDGIGLAFSLDEYVAPHVASGALVRVLEDWCPPFAGFFLYYPSRVAPVRDRTCLARASASVSDLKTFRGLTQFPPTESEAVERHQATSTHLIA